MGCYYFKEVIIFLLTINQRFLINLKTNSNLVEDKIYKIRNLLTLMKKEGVLSIFIIISLLAMTGFVVAESICPGVDDLGNPIHGVQIGGDCFNCGDVDGICPEDFFDPTSGWSCEGIDDDCPPPTPNYFWSKDTTSKLYNLDVDMSIDTEIKAVGINTGLDDGEYEVKVYNTIGWSDTLLKIITGIVTEGKLIGTYIIRENHEEDITGGETGEESYSLYFETHGERSNNLEVTFDYGVEGTTILTCGDYNETECNNDPLKVANNSIITPEERPDNSECYYDKWGKCSWAGTECAQLVYEKEADGNPLSCDSASEESCSYKEGSKIGDCSAGDDFFEINYVTAQTGCFNFTSSKIPCPQELRLPFFGFYSFIASIFAVGLIYLFLKRQ